MTREERAIDLRSVHRLSEASEWLLRLERPRRTEAEYQEWLRWCDEDAENFSAFEKIQQQWQNLEALKSFSEVARIGKDCPSDPEDFELNLTPAQKDALMVQEAQRLIHELAPRSRQARPLATRIAWAIAAGIAIITATVLVSRYDTLIATVPGQFAVSLTNRAATLPDGSKMILGAQSLVNMDFNGPKRQIDLSSGEAYFKVKHDQTRSFVVRAGEVSVTAIGTAFDVRRNRDKITVTVEEGTVEVRGVTRDQKEALWRTEAGYQLTYSMKDRTASLASVNPSTALAWRNGELAYLYEPLGSVVEDLNRYSTRKIIIADPEVAQIPFTGTAFAASLDGWLAGVNQAYNIAIEELPNGDVVLSSR